MLKSNGWVAVNSTHKLTEGEETFPGLFKYNTLSGDQNSLCVKEEVRHRLYLQNIEGLRCYFSEVVMNRIGQKCH